MNVSEEKYVPIAKGEMSNVLEYTVPYEPRPSSFMWVGPASSEAGALSMSSAGGGSTG
jgi:hypothetical protein